MTRLWALAFWTMGAVTLFRIFDGRAQPTRAPICASRRVEYRLRVLGVEWQRIVRESPGSLACLSTGTAARFEFGDRVREP